MMKCLKRQLSGGLKMHNPKEYMDALKKQLDDIDQTGNILQFVLKNRFEGYDYVSEDKIANY